MIRNSVLLRSMRYGHKDKPRRKSRKLFVIIRTEWTPQRAAEFEAKIKLAKKRNGVF